MGCGGSSPAGGGAAQGRAAAGKSNQPKTPVLLFSLPGAAKDYLQNVINADNEANENGKLNLRFIEIPNQRSIRRYWLKELSNPRDYAVVGQRLFLHCRQEKEGVHLPHTPPPRV